MFSDQTGYAYNEKCRDFRNNHFAEISYFSNRLCQELPNKNNFWQTIYPSLDASGLHPARLSYSKNAKTKNSTIDWTTFAITSGALAGLYTGLFRYGQTTRWDAPKRPFYFRSDFRPKGADKLGHFYATKSQAFVISKLYGFSGLNRKQSAIIGASFALSVQTLLEIKDGTISGGGFDVFDQGANILGAGWFYARQQHTFLQRFNIRWLYYPSDKRSQLPANTPFVDDYNGHSYWLSMQIGDWVPYWPRFIVPAAGVTLNDFILEDNQSGHYSYHLSLNLDFTHILPQKSALGRAFSEFLNGFYIPAPALEVYPHPGIKLIFFGHD